MKSSLLGTFCVLVFTLIVSTANAALIDLRAAPITLNGRSLSFEVDGVDVTAAGYKAEQDSVSGDFTIFGPFTTDTLSSSASFTWPGFGRVGLIGQPNTFASGLSLYSFEQLGQIDVDFGGGQILPGFDNQGSTFDAPQTFDFTVFEFSQPVTVSQIIVDDVSNFGRAIWAGGNDAAPDLTQNFLGAFAGFDFRNSIDDATDGFFTHSFSPLVGIQYLAIGAPPNATEVGDLGPLTGRAGGQQFYIEGLNVSVVPVPAAVWLFASALGMLGWMRRKSA